MQREKVTKLSVYQGSAVSSAWQSNGSNINCMAFNLDYIGVVAPELAKELIAIYNKCKKLRSK